MIKVLSLTICFSFILLQTLYAQWSKDAAVADTKVFVGEYLQEFSRSVSDGKGGAIIFWGSYNPGGVDGLGTTYSLYYNHLNSDGFADWASVNTGILLTSGVNGIQINNVITDNVGGAFISWHTYANEDDSIPDLVQHISATGAQLWKAGGLALAKECYNLHICPDSAGGIIGAFSKVKYDSSYFIETTFSQRISAAGLPMWDEEGVKVVNTITSNRPSGIISDGAGGAIISIVDGRNDAMNPYTLHYNNLDIYAQRLSSLGQPVWAASGVPVCTFANNQGFYRSDNNFSNIAPDGEGGAIIVWNDYRNDSLNGYFYGNVADIYTQKINALGLVQWTIDGVAVSISKQDKYNINALPDFSGGVVITWQSDVNRPVFTQRINSTGVAQWTTNGKKIASLNTSLDYTVSLNESGKYFFIGWASEYRSGGFDQINAQKISINDGSLLWGDGAVACSRKEGQFQPSITHDGAGGAIISWSDDRNGNRDIYANRIPSGGSLPVQFVDFSANPKGDDVQLAWSTATQNNVQYFGIQKSIDGVYFNEIGKKAAEGNSIKFSNYKYLDKNAFDLRQLLYYRISETDRDGKTIYSVIRQVKNNDRLFQNIKLIANPVKTNARIEYFSSIKLSAMVKIIDLQGRTVLSSSINIFKGNNQFPLATQALPSGIYTIIISGKEGISKMKMVKE